MTFADLTDIQLLFVTLISVGVASWWRNRSTACRSGPANTAATGRLMSHRDVRPRIGKSDRIAFRALESPLGKHGRTAQEDRQLAETKPLETIPSTNEADGEETQRLRALTVQEIEQILSDDTPR